MLALLWLIFCGVNSAQEHSKEVGEWIFLKLRGAHLISEETDRFLEELSHNHVAAQ